jgi:hypothetical protein
MRLKVAGAPRTSGWYDVAPIDGEVVLLITKNNLHETSSPEAPTGITQ